MAKSTKNTRFSTAAAKSPQDHKAAADEIFEIETSAGIIRVPHIRMTAEEAFNADQDDPRGETRRIIEANADAKAKKQIWALDAFGPESEFAEFMNIWQKASGLDLGE